MFYSDSSLLKSVLPSTWYNVARELYLALKMKSDVVGCLGYSSSRQHDFPYLRRRLAENICRSCNVMSSWIAGHNYSRYCPDKE